MFRSWLPTTPRMPVGLVPAEQGSGAAAPPLFRSPPMHSLLQFRFAGLIHLMLGLLLLGYLGRLPIAAVGIKHIYLLLSDLVVALVLLAGGVMVLRNRRLLLDRPALVALLFAAIGGISTVLAVSRFGLSLTEFTVSIAYLGRWLFYFGLYVVVINFARPADVLPLWRTLELALLVFAGFGILQSALFPNFANMIHPGQWDIQGRRLVSTWMDPNFAGAFIAIGLLIQIGKVSFGVRVPLWKPLLLFVALVLTLSRSAILGGMVGGLAMIAVRGVPKRVVRLLFFTFLLFLPFLPLIVQFAAGYGKFDPGGSAAVRLITWARAITIFVAHPVLGVGFNTYGFVQENFGWMPVHGSDFSLDGGLLFIAVMTGIIGVTIYSGMIGLVMLRCRRVVRDSLFGSDQRGLALGTLGATVALVVQSIFLNSLLHAFLLQVIWILWALVFLVEQAGKRTAPRGVSVLAREPLPSASVLPRLRPALGRSEG